MIILAAMILVYGVCCFGSMKKIAYFYAVLAIVNAAFYAAIYQMDTTENAPWYFEIYAYGVTEGLLKALFLLSVWRFKPVLWHSDYRWLIVLSIAHIINDAFNSFHYGVFNDTLILCEITIFVRGSKGVVAGIGEKLSVRNIRNSRIGKAGL